MSLADFDHVDLIIRVPGQSDRAALVAVDDGRIAEPEEREAALQRKLSAYLALACSHQIAADHPELAGHELSIEVVCAIPPTDAMKRIVSVHPADRPDMVLLVTVSEQAAFRERFGLPATSAGR